MTEDLPPPQSLLFGLLIFAIELVGLAGFARWGWSTGGGGVGGLVLATAFVLVSAGIWGIFRVRNDPPGKVDQPVVVPGPVRLMIELLYYALAAAGWWISGQRAVAETLLTIVVLLYVVTWDRQHWLVHQ